MGGLHRIESSGRMDETIAGLTFSSPAQTPQKGSRMSDTTCHMSISLDGFVAGPNQSEDDPLGVRGREVHTWHLGDERATEADETAAGWLMRPRGSYVMGRTTMGPIRIALEGA